MRDIVNLFTDRDSRDELGIGQIRDALGDALFPGSSTLHTRAKYLLFVPWIYQRASASKGDHAREADRLERRLIPALKQSSNSAGLIGEQAGSAVKVLPSSMYWSALERYGILTDPTLSRADVANLPEHPWPRDLDNTDAAAPVWSPEMPAAPKGFPLDVPDGFALTHTEASWLRDRIASETSGTLLAHFLDHRPADDSRYVWEDPAAAAATGEAKEMLDHAQTFSAVMHGAQLLYNILIAGSYEALQLDRIADPVEAYRERFAEWAANLDAEVDRFAWDLDDLLARLAVVRGAPIRPGTATFTCNWLNLTREHDLNRLPDLDEARRLITRRERTNKPGLYRIGASRKRLAMWGGGSQSARLAIRWGSVRALLTDIHRGLNAPIEVPDA